MPNILSVFLGSIFLSGLLGLCVGYIFGLERGMSLERIGTVLPSIPGPLRSFSRRAKHSPKSVSEHQQWEKEKRDNHIDME